MIFDFESIPLLFILEKTLISTAILLGAYLFYRIIILIFKTLLKKRVLHDTVIRILNPVLKAFISIIAFFIVIQYNGVSIGNLWALISTLFAMMAIGFVAVWSVISNFLCTLLLILTKPFRIGDYIEVTEPTASDQSLGGKVVNISMLYTILQESENSSVLLPNNLFFQKAIRRKKGKDTYSIDEQIFKENSLLHDTKEAKQ